MPYPYGAKAGGNTASAANSAFYGDERSLGPAEKGRIWAERAKSGESYYLPGIYGLVLSPPSVKMNQSELTITGVHSK